MITKQEKESRVLRELLKASEPIGPTEIARRIDEPWCVFEHQYRGEIKKFPQSSPIVPVLRRIGAVRHKGGLYSKPE